MTEPAHLGAVRTAYDTVAANYADGLDVELAAKPLDRAMVAAFAELVPTGTPVADLGCGPGHVTAHLSRLGLAAFGIDLSPAMVEIARTTNPELRFDLGTMTGLDLPDDSLGGILARYSIIHTPPPRLPAVFREFRRVLRPDGVVLLAFQVGDERVHVSQGYGHPVSLDAYRLSPDRITDQLADAGLTVFARLHREPDGAEKVPQANLLARSS